MRAEVPIFRAVDALTGTVASPIGKILDTADEIAAQALSARLTHEAFGTAAGFYDCPCGSEYEFDEDSTLEDYAGLNRWLGQHMPCSVLAAAELDRVRAENASLKAPRACRN